MSKLDHLRKEWTKTHNNMSLLTSSLKGQIADAQERVDELEGPYREQLKALEDEMRPLVTPDTAGVAHGLKIAYRKAYNRIVWNSKGLDGYMVHDKKLRNFREVRKTEASVTFSRAKDE